jgi:MFS family permease
MPITSMLVAPWTGRLSDRIGGKYILMAGLVLFAVGTLLIAWIVSPTADQWSFAVPLILMGFGQGCIFAPLSTMAMRNIDPRMAGAASGVFNTTRQVGAVLGSAIVGAVLQVHLVAEMHSRAIASAALLPSELRQLFVNAFQGVGKAGLEVGRTSGGAIPLPAGLPQDLAQQLGRLAHEVFINGFVAAMPPTLAVSAVALLIGALSMFAAREDRMSMGAEAAWRASAEASSPRREPVPLPGERRPTRGWAEGEGRGRKSV